MHNSNWNAVFKMLSSNLRFMRSTIESVTTIWNVVIDGVNFDIHLFVSIDSL